MTISIQASTAAQIAHESLNPPQLGPAGAGAGAAAPPGQAPPAAAGETAASVHVSGLPAILNGETGALVASATLADTAVSAGTTIEGLLARLRQDAVSASDPTLSGDVRAALDTGFKADLAGIQSTIAQASVGGVNLIDGSSAGVSPGTAASLSGADLTLGGPLIGLSAGASLADPSQAGAIAEQLGSAIDNVRQAVGGIAAQGEAIQKHLAVLQQAGLSLAASPPEGFGAALASDGARLQALQVQQQLIARGGSIANLAPQSILALFRQT